MDLRGTPGKALHKCGQRDRPDAAYRVVHNLCIQAIMSAAERDQLARVITAWFAQIQSIANFSVCTYDRVIELRSSIVAAPSRGL